MRVLHYLANAGFRGAIAVLLLGIGFNRDRRQGLLFSKRRLGHAKQTRSKYRPQRQYRSPTFADSHRRHGKTLNLQNIFLALFHKQSYVKSVGMAGWHEEAGLPNMVFECD